MKYRPSHKKQLEKRIERSEHREESKKSNWNIEHSQGKQPHKKKKPAKIERFSVKEEDVPIKHQEQPWQDQYAHEKAKSQLKKQQKQKAKSEKEHKIHIPKDIEEKNKLQQHRTPMIRKRSHGITKRK